MNNDLRERISTVVESGQVTWSELSQAVEYSATTLSQWKNGKYPGDTAGLETKLAEWLARNTAPSLTFRDSMTLTSILALLDESDDRHSILAALTRFGL